MTCNFTFKHYDECMQICSLLHFPGTSSIELIHDIDSAEENLLEIGQMEANWGLSAKYFIRIHAKQYNPFSLKNINMYKKLIELGHEIGLHFEPNFYEKGQIREAIEKQVSLFSFELGTPVKLISLHEPARFGTIDESFVPEGLTLYCYTSEHYKGKKYISDSGGRWREGCMCNHLGKHDKMIILTHPWWWFEKNSAENY